ncbi:MAG: hypothetical protein ACI8R8_002311, partial [Paraglaciecola sp.]
EKIQRDVSLYFPYLPSWRINKGANVRYLSPIPFLFFTIFKQIFLSHSSITERNILTILLLICVASARYTLPDKVL